MADGTTTTTSPDPTATPNTQTISMDPLININPAKFKELETSLLSGSLTVNVSNMLHTLNGTTNSGILFHDKEGKHLNKIRKLSNITDLGKSENSHLLDFIEGAIISFIELSATKLDENISKFYNNYSGDILTDMYLSLAILNHNFINTQGNKGAHISNLTVISDRLSKYIPDIFIQITKTMPDKDDSKKNIYLLINHIFFRIFKTNETYVNLGIMDSFNSVFNWIKTRHTVEIVVAIIAFAFVVSKIFDMFRVKVEV
jgi:hypothetical protein